MLGLQPSPSDGYDDGTYSAGREGEEEGREGSGGNGLVSFQRSH